MELEIKFNVIALFYLYKMQRSEFCLIRSPFRVQRLLNLMQ